MVRRPTVRQLRRVVMWTANRKFTSGSLVVIFNESHEVLLVQERFRDRGAWGFPGGYVKRGETHESNVVREVSEEIHVDLAAVTFVAYYVQDRAAHFDALFTATLQPSQTPRAGRELREVRWFSCDALPANLTVEANRALRVLYDTTADERLTAAVGAD